MTTTSGVVVECWREG